MVVAFHFSLLSMWASGMLDLTDTGQPVSAYWVPSAGAPDWWDYPALVIFTPQSIVAFPPALTLLMLSEAGLLGLTVAASVNLLTGRDRPAEFALRGRVEGLAPPAPIRFEAAPVLVALASLGTGCGADFTVAGLDLLGGSSATTRASLAGLSLALGIFDLALMLASLWLLEEALRRASDGPVDRPPRVSGRRGR